jgi:biotin transport system substrate-specific component
MATDAESVELVDADVVANLARAAVLAALTGAFAVAGAVPIPLSPVPLSLQPLAVFLAGLLLGARWGAGAMALYLAAGALGAPVFAGGEAGIGVLAGDSAGYLWGYVLAAGVVGLVTHGGLDAGDLTSVSVPRQVLALVAGTLVIYAAGIVGLMVVLDVSPRAAVVSGALVFLPGEVLKMAAAVAIVRSDDLARVAGTG